MEYKCCNCACSLKDIQKRRTLRAKSIQEQKVHVTSADALRSLGIDLSPEEEVANYICYSCFSVISKIAKSTKTIKQAQSKLKKDGKCDSYLSLKLERLNAEGNVHTSQQTTKKSAERQTGALASHDYHKKKKYQRSSFLNQAATWLQRGKYRQVMSVMKKSRSFNKIFAKSVCETITKEVKATSPFQTTGKNKLLSIEAYAWRNAYKELQRLYPMLMTMLTASLGRDPTKIDKVRLTMAAAVLLFTKDPRTNNIVHQLITLLLSLGGCNRQLLEKLHRLGVCTDAKGSLKFVKALRMDSAYIFQHQKLLITEHNETATKEPLHQSNEWQDVPGSEEGVPSTSVQDESLLCKEYVIMPMETSSSPIDKGSSVAPAAAERPVPEDDEPMMVASSPQEIPPSGEGGASSHADETITYGDTARRAPPLGYTLGLDKVDHMTKTTSDDEGQTGQPRNLIQVYGAIDRIHCLHMSDKAPSSEDLLNIPQDIFIPNRGDINMLRDEYEVMIGRILSRHIPCFKNMEVTDHIWHPYVVEMKEKSTMVPLGVLEKDRSKFRDMMEVLDHLHKYVPGTQSPVPLVIYGDQMTCEKARDAVEACNNEDTPWAKLHGLHPSIQERHKRLLLLKDTYKLLYDATSASSCGSLSFIKHRFGLAKVRPRFVSKCFDDATNMLRFATEGHVVAAACEHMGIARPSDAPEVPPADGQDMSTYWNATIQSVMEKAFDSFHIEPTAKSAEGDSHCTCKQNLLTVPMVQCSNLKCDRGLWFHETCVGVNVMEIPTNLDWFCSSMCRERHQEQEEDMDSKFHYSRALMYLGLQEMVHHDAIREGDGVRMVQHWRLAMFYFFQNDHWKSLIEGHHLIMDVNGGVSPRLAHQLVWNRTVNPHGGKGENIAMDLADESPSKYDDDDKDKRMITRAQRRIITQNITRRYDQVNHRLKKCVSRFFDPKVMDERKLQKRVEQGRAAETAQLAELLVEEKCLVRIPGRSHPGFEGFQFDVKFDELDRYKEKMSALFQERVLLVQMKELLQ